MATPTDIRRRGRWSLILGTVFAALMVAAVAYADEIQNDLAGSAYVMALNVGGSAGSTNLTVVERNGDGKQGCNLTGSRTLVVSVSSDAPSIATVSPSSLTFGSCGDIKTVTVTPVAAGTANVTISQISNTTSGSFDLAKAQFAVNVAPPPNTAPTVSVTGVEHGANYPKGSVPAAGCSVQDAEDGTSSPAPSLGVIEGAYASDGIGMQTVTCSYTDQGGLAAVAAATYAIVDPSAPGIGHSIVGSLGNNDWYVGDVNLSWLVTEPESPLSLSKIGCENQSITADQPSTDYTCSATSAGGSSGPVVVSIKRDATPPAISGSRSPSANAAGWNNTDVEVSFACADERSGVASCGPSPVTLSSNGAAQSVIGTAVDNAGNSTMTTISEINIDKLAPSVAYTSASPAPNEAGWNNTDVVATFTATDTLSGFAPSGALTDTATSATSFEGSDVTVGSPEFADQAGNSAGVGTATSASFKIDKTKPVVTVTGVSDGATYTLGAVPLAGCSTTDALSLVKTAATLSSSGGPVGSVTASCNGAEDNAGNTNSGSATYSVHYDWSGFRQPVDNLPSLNTVRAGSAVPVKFSLSGNQGLSIFAPGYPTSNVATCDAGASEDVIEATLTAGGSSLSYDAAADQYVYVWKTDKAWAGQCRQLRVKLADGTLHAANFKLLK